MVSLRQNVFFRAMTFFCSLIIHFYAKMRTVQYAKKKNSIPIQNSLIYYYFTLFSLHSLFSGHLSIIVSFKNVKNEVRRMCFYF